MIQAIGLCKEFGDKTVVADIDLTVNSGEMFGFLGPNGAGKTTTIKMMTGVLRPTAGTVFINGVNIHTEPAKAKRSISFVPDTPYTYERLDRKSVV